MMTYKELKAMYENVEHAAGDRIVIHAQDFESPQEDDT